ncbi:UDP-glucose 4-epimerase GalE [Salipaludibacillus keqinensis]|uniref:UDP-glucose 4-epimerase n=1 Tax=Salipaludibacillus keqinensis TaxID=2045207 RepID=A0A323TAV1_9BACI|nr:UDP-glucose 4-epimerase GalE [Salipaludibacillus keqinensis]PYZ92056.1 UDP-glucose 4-epimerase GalE [Salipaludibacillus keqinensis]
MTVLICGGAGYIGSHAVAELIEKKEDVIVIDNLQTGHRSAVSKEATFYEGDLRDEKVLDRVFTNHQVDSVIHFAADSLVGVSVEKPLEYYDNNVYGALCLLKKMEQYKVEHIVFSSTAATYGEPENVPIKETEVTAPTNPYGETKLAIEKMLKWCANAYGMKYVALRYFNVAGAHPTIDIGEDHQPETHLIPIVLQVALGQRDKIMIFGDDYNTPDGTCIRDYIHVKDLIQAHLLALTYLRDGGDSDVFNLGNESGFSVKEVVDAVEKVTGKEIPREIAARRGGDPATLVASSEKAKTTLGWEPKYPDLESIIETAWKWHQRHPEGYKS